MRFITLLLITTILSSFTLKERRIIIYTTDYGKIICKKADVNSTAIKLLRRYCGTGYPGNLDMLIIKPDTLMVIKY